MSIKFAGLNTDRTWAEAEKNIVARRAERNVLRTERDAIVERIRSQIDKIQDTAHARLEAVAMGKPYQEKETEEERLGELNRQIAMLDQAIELLLERQRRAASQHSIKVCSHLKSEHDALATSVFDSVLNVQNAVTAYQGLLTTLEDAGILTGSFPQGVTPSFIECHDKYGRLAHWLNEMAHIGLLSRSKIPARLDFTR